MGADEVPSVHGDPLDGRGGARSDGPGDGPDDQGARSDEPSGDDADLERFLVELGSELVRSGESASWVIESLREIGTAMGSRRTEVLVFPRALLVETDQPSGSRIELASALGSSVRFDRDVAIHDIAVQAARNEISPAEGCRRVEEVRARPPRFGWPVRILGGAVWAAGTALILQPTLLTLLLATPLGMLVAALQEIKIPELQVVIPSLTAFLAAMIVFGLDTWIDTANPIRVLVAPLVMLLPGLMILTSSMELAAGEMVVGAARMFAGLMQLLLLAVAIVAAVDLLGVDDAALADRPLERLGVWAPVFGLFVLNAGFFLKLGTPNRVVPLIALVQVVTFSAQATAATTFGPEISGFFGALVMTPLAMLLASRAGGLPIMVLLIPGFGVLMPGAASLIGITRLVDPVAATAGTVLATTMTTIVSIALGVLMGSSLVRTGRRLVTV